MTERIIKTFTFLFLFLCLPVYGEDAEIILKERVVVPGPVVCLGELANIKCSDGDFVKKLAGIEIANSPAPLKSRTLKRAYIMSRLKQNQIDVEGISLTGSDNVIFSTDIKEVTGEDIVECARKYVESKLTYEIDERVIIIDKKFDSYFVPFRGLHLSVIERKVGILKGQFYVTVGIYNDDFLYRSLVVPVKVRTFENVVVTRKDIMGGNVIKQEDVVIERKETTTFGEDLMYSVEEAVGKRTKMTLKESTILKDRVLEDIPLVEKGNPVTITVARGGVLITVTGGKAMQSGSLKEYIRVLNMRSNENLLAQVVGRDSVIVR